MRKLFSTTCQAISDNIQAVLSASLIIIACQAGNGCTIFIKLDKMFKIDSVSFGLSQLAPFELRLGLSRRRAGFGWNLLYLP